MLSRNSDKMSKMGQRKTEGVSDFERNMNKKRLLSFCDSVSLLVVAAAAVVLCGFPVTD